MEDRIQSLAADALQRLELYERERERLGHATAQEVYWGGYIDALMQTLDRPTRSNLDWTTDGMACMFSKQEMDRQLTDKIRTCNACDLHKTRTQAVPGEGPLWTPLMCVGRDPGKQENAIGRPFVGDSGEFLFNPQEGVIPTTLGYQRENIRISNVNKCQSPGNRGPTPEEVLSCGPYLRWEILNVRPKVIIAFGKLAASWFAGQETPIGQVRGRVLKWEGISVVPTYHPSYILRTGKPPEMMAKVRGDLQIALQELQK